MRRIQVKDVEYLDDNKDVAMTVYGRGYGFLGRLYNLIKMPFTYVLFGWIDV